METGIENHRKDEPVRRQLAWYLFCRVLVITLFLGGTILYNLRSGFAHPDLTTTYLYLLIAVSYAQALPSAVFLPKFQRFGLFTQLQIVWDLLFAVALIYLTGGIESPFAFLFILIIISASVFLHRRDIFIVAAAATILYGSLLDLQYYGYLPHLRGLIFPQQFDAREMFYAVFVNALAFLLTAALGAVLSDRLRRSEQALEKKKIDFVELDNLNRTILANIGSGLMIINPRGRIRSFNKAAENISGYSLEDVYDRDVRELFPSLAVFDGTLQLVERGEGVFDSPKTGRRILGYASSHVKGADGQNLGLLVTFKDMTWVKEMEERLKRADRLAAVGQLASGMAHEIRNPLASISGSVQLLMEGEGIRAEDRQLMHIVVKEANRLSGLLDDFLQYARPGTPNIVDCNVSSVLDELTQIAIADPRFVGVEIRRAYPPAVTMAVDQKQLAQAMWNLLINGAEAMPAGGILTVGLDPDARQIFVEDTGPGIPETLRNQIFNPFFTTKDHGTGLGLATVYSIVEAHRGTISVAGGCQGGARFLISLP